tara:strand:- start:104 stop:340 length:237 start_codon:yes stop_codon:yes gene_type:complete
MFDINNLIEKLEDKFSPEILNDAVQGLVRKGILEQYIDQDGSFKFELTDLGIEVAEDIINDPISFLDMDDIQDDGMDN